MLCRLTSQEYSEGLTSNLKRQKPGPEAEDVVLLHMVGFFVHENVCFVLVFLETAYEARPE